jgi:hypothetical protein
MDREDELVWQFYPHGSYTPKLGYIQLNIEQHLREPSLVVERIFGRLNFPLKSHIFMWCMIMNQLPTWDQKKRQVRGRGGAHFAKTSEETMVHLF